MDKTPSKRGTSAVRVHSAVIRSIRTDIINGKGNPIKPLLEICEKGTLNGVAVDQSTWVDVLKFMASRILGPAPPMAGGDEDDNSTALQWVKELKERDAAVDADFTEVDGDGQQEEKAG